MKKYRNFKCAECKDIIERLVNDEVLVVNCTCKGLASRQLSAPRCFSNSATCEGKSPSAR